MKAVVVEEYRKAILKDIPHMRVFKIAKLRRLKTNIQVYSIRTESNVI